MKQREIGLPPVKAEELTSAQKEYLQRIGKYKEGMTRDEASKIIEEQPMFMKDGLYLVKIHKIVDAMDKNGSPILDKNDNPGIEITFINNDGQMISDIFFYSETKEKECRSEWKLAKLKSRLGFNHDEEVDLEEAKKRKIWLIVCKSRLYDKKTRNPLIADDGTQKVMYKATSHYFEYEGKDKKPNVKPEYFEEDIYVASKGNAGKYSSNMKKNTDEENPFKDEEKFTGNDEHSSNVINDEW